MRLPFQSFSHILSESLQTATQLMPPGRPRFEQVRLNTLTIPRDASIARAQRVATDLTESAVQEYLLHHPIVTHRVEGEGLKVVGGLRSLALAKARMPADAPVWVLIAPAPNADNLPRLVDDLLTPLIQKRDSAEQVRAWAAAQDNQELLDTLLMTRPTQKALASYLGISVSSFQALKRG